MRPLFRPQIISPSIPRTRKLKTGATHEVLISAAERHLRATVLPETEDVNGGTVDSTISPTKG